ncbi:hypothetical protein VFPFJ_11358 [Purpureocillium lilacinum]|uniref:2EXR domain-containing protein n=1 Tax=Purpureocillium lilacinum TaxID=33203 RepID=A0A179FER3_PURLI|nr:hypothetical protein VFPFJ_11358 [Purpureocillium lilacinum]OAQ63828.1 hypothetical protein VFPFJ_11358 [Purpureocillium lilacinum]
MTSASSSGMHLNHPDSPGISGPQAKNEHSQAQDHTLQDENRDLTFFSFMDLPPELRSLIWERALPDRRIIYITVLDTPATCLNPKRILFCLARPPAILHACRESRDVALTCFQLFFNTRFTSIDGSFEIELISRPIYLRPKIDILYFDTMDCFSFAQRYPEIHQVTSFAIRYNDIPIVLPDVRKLLVVTSTEGELWPDRARGIVELSPDSHGGPEALEWAEIYAEASRINDCVSSIQHVEPIVLRKSVHAYSYFD